MPNLRGDKLPAGDIRLSNYLDNNNEDVRITGLKIGQTVIVDVPLDGEYRYPDQPAKAPWVSPDGSREGVHTALFTVAKSNGFAVVFDGRSELTRSRGRGLSIANCESFEIYHAYVRGARTAGIALQECERFTLHRPTTVNTSNYQTERVDVNQWNVSGSIKLDRCHDYRLVNPISLEHMGNGITATQCSKGHWLNPFTYAVHGANQYINASPEHTVYRGLAVGGTSSNRPPAFVINSEQENEGASEAFAFEECYCIDTSWGLGVWGNESKDEIPIQRGSLINSILISQNGNKFHRDTPITDFDDSGTLDLLQAKKRKNGEIVGETLTGFTDDEAAFHLGLLRYEATTLAEMVRNHAESAAIDAKLLNVYGVFESLRRPVAPSPIDREVLTQLLDQGDQISAVLAEWLTQVRKLV